MAVLKVFFHDACFDGTASAALFLRFARAHLMPNATFVAAPMQHTDGDPFARERFDADMHACVDFRYTDHPSLTWWFDHHRTAFQPETLRATFEARAASTHVFDPDAASCAGLLARRLGQSHEWTLTAAQAELVAWADRIDAAAFSSAAEATRLDTPAQELALWVSTCREPSELARYIELLASDGLSAARADRKISTDLTQRKSRVQRARDEWRQLGQVRDHVAFFDLPPTLEAAPGLFAYTLFPQCRYTLAITRAPNHVKVSVGHNPWSAQANDIDIGALCAQWGGGGHRGVGGITLARANESRALTAAHAVMQVLSRA